MTASVASKVTSGAAWMVSLRGLDFAVGMVSTIILARLLTPADFGLVALATSLAAMLDLLKSFDFGALLIQRQAAGRAQYDTAWTFNVLLSSLIASLLLLAAEPLARFYDDGRLVGIVTLISAAKFIEGFENIGIVNFRKEFRFSKEFTFRVTRRVLTFCVTLLLALTYRNYWALVIGIAGGKLVGVTLSYALHAYRPSLTTRAWRELFAFSRWIALNAVAHVLTLRFGDFLVGKLAGPSSLGVFTLANEIAFTPSSEVGAPLNTAVYPGYARVAHDRDRLRDAYYRVLAAMALVVLPCAVGLMSTADSLIRLLLGEKWLAAIPLVPILALRGLIHSLVSNVPYVFLAIGRPNLATLVLVVRTIILIPSLWIGLQYSGLVGAAWAYAASLALEIPINFFVLRGQVNVKAAPLLAAVWRPLISATVMAVAVRWMSTSWAIPDGVVESALRLAAIVGVGAVFYVGVVRFIWQLCGRPDGAEKMAVDAMRSRVQSWMGRRADPR